MNIQEALMTAVYYQARGYHDYTLPRAEGFWAMNVRIGDSNRQYKQQIRQKLDASTNYTRITYSDIKQPVYSGIYNRVVGRDLIPTEFYGYWSLPSCYGRVFNPSARLSDQVTHRFRNKVRALSGEFNAVAPVAELRELRDTVRISASFTTDLVKTLIDLKHLRLRDAAKRASEHWLNFSFGIKPLLSDTEAAAQAVARALEVDRLPNAVIVSKGEEPIQFSVPIDLVAVSAQSNGKAVFNGSLTYKLKGGWVFPLASANNYNSHFGLDVPDLIPAAWELVPYSWVMDYFTNVGSYLEDTFSSPGGNTVYLNEIISVDLTCTGNFPAFIVPAPWFGMAFDNVTESGYKYKSYVRRSIPAIPAPHLRVKSVDEIGRNAVNRLLNLTSILGSGLGPSQPSPQRNRR